jgi:hypothetical protein
MKLILFLILFLNFSIQNPTEPVRIRLNHDNEKVVINGGNLTYTIIIKNWNFKLYDEEQKKFILKESKKNFFILR